MTRLKPNPTAYRKSSRFTFVIPLKMSLLFSSLLLIAYGISSSMGDGPMQQCMQATPRQLVLCTNQAGTINFSANVCGTAASPSNECTLSSSLIRWDAVPPSTNTTTGPSTQEIVGPFAAGSETDVSNPNAVQVFEFTKPDGSNCPDVLIPAATTQVAVYVPAASFVAATDAAGAQSNHISARTAWDFPASSPKHAPNSFSDTNGKYSFTLSISPASTPENVRNGVTCDITGTEGGNNSTPPYAPGNGSVAQHGTALEFLYTSFDEPQSAKYPRILTIDLVPMYNNCTIGSEMDPPVQVIPVFNYLRDVMHDYDDALDYIIWKYGIDVSVFKQTGNSIVYDPAEASNAHTYATFGPLLGGNGTRNCHVGPAAFGSENLLASTVYHETQHGDQSDYYFRWYCTEKQAEQVPYTAEGSFVGTSGLRGDDLTLLDAWVAYVNDTTGAVARPATGGH